MNVGLIGKLKRSPLVGRVFSFVITPRLDPLEMIEVQRRQIRNREYIPIGRLARIMFGEGCLPNPAPDNPFVGSASERPPMPALDWRGEGPMLARSKDGEDYLICGPMIHPPPLPDPHPPGQRPIYGKPNTEDYDENGCRLKYKTNKLGISVPMLDAVPTIPQSLLNCAYIGPGGKWVYDRMAGKYKPSEEWFFLGKKEEHWMLFQPVAHVMFYPHEGAPAFINGSPDRHNQPWTFLYDRQRQEGHLIFGRKELGFYRVLEQEPESIPELRQKMGIGYGERGYGSEVLS